MIWESCYWKDPLIGMADRLPDLIQKKEWTDEEGAQFERDVFIGMYSVRKLFEAPAKVSDETKAMKLRVVWFPKREGQPLVDWFNRNEFWELYDLESSHRGERDAIFIVHRLIHSFVFVPSVPFENDPAGVFFTSDVDKERCIYFIEVDEIARLFREAGTDYPDIEMHRDQSTGEMKVRAYKPIDG